MVNIDFYIILIVFAEIFVFSNIFIFNVIFILVLTELVASIHSLRDKGNIIFKCPCTSKQNVLTKLPVTNGVSQVPQSVPRPDPEHWVSQ